MKKKYILNGKIYDENILNSFAQKSNLSFDDYLKESGASEHNDPHTYILNGKEYDGHTMAEFAQKSDMPYDEYLKEAGVKKKDGTQDLAASVQNAGTIAAPTSSPSQEGQKQLKGSVAFPELDDPITLAQQANDLQNKTKEVTTNEGVKGTPLTQNVPDQDAIDASNKIKEGLKSKGIDADKLYEQFKDVPESLYTLPGFAKQELLQEKKENPQRFERKLATGKWQLGFKDQLDNDVDDGSLSPEAHDNIWHSVLDTQNNSDVGDYSQRRQGIQNLATAINQYGGENKDKLLQNLAIDRVPTYGMSFNTDFDKAYKADPRSAYLDKDQLLAMHYLEDTNPDAAKGYNSILVDPKKIGDNQDAKTGYEDKMLRLKEIGVGLQQSSVQEELNDLGKIASHQGGLNPDQQKKAADLTLKQEELNQSSTDANTKYGSTGYYNRDAAVQEILGQRNTGAEWLANKTGAAVVNTGEGIWDLVSEPFRSDENSKIHQLEAAGESTSENSLNYLSQKNSALKNFEMKMQPELQSQIDPIIKDDKLDYQQKYDKIYNVLRDNPNQWGRVPIQGGKTNISPSSLFYSVGGLASQLVPFMALEAATGGGATATMGRKLLSSFTAAAATGFHEAYANAVKDGEANPFGYALRITAINSAALAGAQTPEAIRSILGTKTAVGELVNKMTDDAIEGALKENTPTLKAFGKTFKTKPITEVGKAAGESVLNSTKEGAKITGFTTGGQVLNNAISGKENDPETLAKEALINVLTFSVGGGIAGISGKYDKINNLQSDALVKASQQPELFIEAAQNQLKNGTLNQEQFNNIKQNIDKAAEISKSVPFVDNKGKPLTAKNRGELMLLKMQEKSIKESISGDVPPTLKEKGTEKLEELNTKMEEVYKNKNEESPDTYLINDKPVSQKEFDESVKNKKEASYEYNGEDAARIQNLKDIGGSTEKGTTTVDNENISSQKQTENEKASNNADAEAQRGQEVTSTDTVPQKGAVSSIENLKNENKNIQEPTDIVDSESEYRLVEPEKPISEMDSEELYNLAIENKRALRKQDFEFKDKTENEKEDEGYYNVIDDVEDLRDASERMNYIENSENISDLASSVKSTISNIKRETPNEYQLAILNAAKKRAEKLKISPQDLIKGIAKKVYSQYKDVDDAEFMVKNYLEKLIPKNKENETRNIQQPIAKADEGVGKVNESKPTEKGSDAAKNVDENIEGTKKIGGETPPIESGISSVYIDPKNTILSHRGLQEVATQFGLNDITSRERKSDLQLFKDAETTIDKWVKEGNYSGKVDGLVKDAEDGKVLTDEQRVIVQQHIANVRGEMEGMDIHSEKYDTKLKELQRLVKAGETTRSAVGAALRVPNLGSTEKQYDLPDIMVGYMEANNVDVLTDAQKEQATKQYEDIKKKTDEAQSKLDEINAKYSEMLAQKEFSNIRSTTKRTKKAHADFVVERKNIGESIREKLRVARSEANVTPIPYAKELFTIAPDVLRLVKSYAEEGIIKLEEVIKKIHADFKDDISNLKEKDIHNIIAGEYNKKKKTKNELASNFKDLKDEAILINKLEKLLNDEEPKKENKKIERNREIVELKNKIDGFKKEQNEANKLYTEEYDTDAKKLVQLKKRNEERVKKIKEDIIQGNFDSNPKVPFIENKELKQKYPKLFNQTIDAITAKEEAKNEYDIALLKEQMNQRSTLQKITDYGGKLANTTKAVVTGIDDSALFVQTLAAMMVRPIIATKVLKAHALDALSKKRFERNLTILHNSPDWDLMKKSGLSVTEPKSISEQNKEEAFADSIDVNIKIGDKKYNIIKEALAPFERAFTSLGNGMRVLAFRSIVEKYKAEGKTFENSPKLYKDLATILNTETGRGKENEFIERASKLVTKGIWSPKLMSSRLNMLGIGDIASIGLSKAGTKGYYRQLSKEARLMAIGDVAKFATSVMALSYVAAWSFGGKVDTDPTSQSFLDIQIGDKSYNIAGGFSQYIRLVAQTIAGGKTVNGQFKKFSGGKDIGSNMLHFMRGKVTPVAGTGIDLMTGKDFSGSPVTLGAELKKLTIPMSLQSAASDIQKNGVSSIFTNTLPNFVGINVKDKKDFANSGSYTEEDLNQPENKVLSDHGITISEPVDRDKFGIESDEDFDKFKKARRPLFDEGVKELYNKGVDYSKDGEKFIKLDINDKEKLKSQLKENDISISDFEAALKQKISTIGSEATKEAKIGIKTKVKPKMETHF